MAAVLVRAIRDVYHHESWMRKEAKDWLRSSGADVIRVYGVRVQEVNLVEWIKSDFDEGRVRKDRYLQDSRDRDSRTFRF
jgi:hypothetical protein